jgi:hypothetical protein
MHGRADKRHRADLDLFILALIGDGVSTPYALQREAGISQGASVPVLRRLSAARWIRHKTAGPRGRTDYSLTAAGKKAVMLGCKTLVESGPTGDFDSDLRIALLVIWAGGDRRIAQSFLRQVGDMKMESVAATKLTSDAVAPLARWYTDLRSSAGKALLAAEADAIRVVVDSLPKKLNGKPKPIKRPTKSRKVS